jgi:hypothetical protein
LREGKKEKLRGVFSSIDNISFDAEETNLEWPA